MTTQTTSHNGSSSHHGSHRHSRRVDGATKFKRDSLNSIERRKLMKKWAFASLVMIACLMFMAVIWVYTAG